eukprot:TRINITY_DN57782_c0_g1_i1.p3 TRINITY_DN57782_c0_g1~~TRINITY_DN57782_c0_g1_i1.p3  ORF type:complete len:123 (-),score=14.18 TRINITY_DN57782_c0_g1_i1:236-604(-)
MPLSRVKKRPTRTTHRQRRTKTGASAPALKTIKIDPLAQFPPPDLTKIKPGDTQDYMRIWYQAHKLADYVDGGEATAPYEERIKKLPELNSLLEKMRTMETKPTNIGEQNTKGNQKWKTKER